MPTISRFYGILILMFFAEDAGHQPHFHARYGGFAASYGIDPPTRLAGGLPVRAEKLVLEWAAAHQAELLENWQRAGRREPLLPVVPLD